MGSQHTGISVTASQSPSPWRSYMAPLAPLSPSPICTVGSELTLEIWILPPFLVSWSLSPLLPPHHSKTPQWYPSHCPSSPSFSWR